MRGHIKKPVTWQCTADCERDPFVPGRIVFYITLDPKGHVFKNAAGDLLPAANNTCVDTLYQGRHTRWRKDPRRKS